MQFVERIIPKDISVRNNILAFYDLRVIGSSLFL